MADPTSVARALRATVLVGTTGCRGAFPETTVREVARHAAAPVVLPLSNPGDRAEARPEDILDWTDGRALVATGSPSADVESLGARRVIGQANNVFIFPGVGLGATAVGARWLPDDAFTAAARALGEFTPGSLATGAPIFPSVLRLREVSRAVAVAVGAALVDAGAAPPMTPAEIECRVAGSIWEPEYLPYRAMSAWPAELETGAKL